MSEREHQPERRPQEDLPRTADHCTVPDADEHAEPIPQQIGRFLIRRRLGRGGFGVVYLAHDPGLDRLVALKVPRSELLVTGQQRENFLHEARTAAKLKHPALVTVHEVQQEGNSIYIVQEYIDGQNLAQWASAQARTWEDIARRMIEIATAMGYVHQQGFYHRDLKPGNILIDNEGHAHVADFGLAVHEDALHVLKGQASGTPQYMSPEQVRGETHWTDGRTDIWALGVILYELLSGQRPFTAPDRLELFEEIQERDPKPPRMKNPAIPKELERICFKCLAKRRTHRYANAADLLEDLQVFLATRPDGEPASIPDRTPEATVDPASGAVAGGGSTVRADAESTPRPSIPTPDSGSQPPLRIVPKGLRSFDEEDKDFFLELLPGPRDREGLPDTIRFWKTRIERIDAEATFPVGVMYGPSGCGKSSLVKAGLLPHLAPHVLSIFVEATLGDTELRLLKALRKHIPCLAAETSLAEAIAQLREGRVPDGRKVLLVLDQFEQWLHATTNMDSSQLVRALRQCDGARAQCLILIRDDFWMSTTRFMQALEIPQVESQNSAAVDLFDPTHARKVLRAFGSAYGRLPEHDLSADEQRFLDRAVEDLAQDGKVICVQLSLFADMMKSRQWTPASLQEVGGTSGVGVAFLDETFTSKTAPPTHRLHAKAAQAVLKTLLPDVGTDIKGQMQPAARLLECSGYAARPDDFSDLLQILNRELRLITPTEPEGADAGEAVPWIPRAKQRFYQLTHDYLVPSLRDWLTHKQRETQRGRAELMLAERSALWHAKPENRHLPSIMEFVNIRTQIDRKNWTEPQRMMMARARRVHGWRSLIAVLLALLSAWGGFEVYGRFQAQYLLAVDPASLAGEIQRVSPWQAWARRYLHNVVQRTQMDDAKHNHQLHARLALTALTGSFDPKLLDALYACDIPYLGVVREALRPYSAELSPSLWVTQHDTTRPASQRFRAGLALAAFETESEHWSADDYALLARQLVTQNPIHQPLLWPSLRPLAHRLVPELEKIFANQKLPTDHQIGAANALAEFASDDVPRLTRLLTTATAAQDQILYPLVLGSLDGTAKSLLADLVAGQPTDNLSETGRVALGQRRAGAAVSLLRCGDVERSCTAFQFQDDPESLTQFVHRCRDRGVTANELVQSLRSATDVNRRFALLLTLGDYSLAEIDTTQHDWLIKDLVQAYGSDPSSAIHGATGWLLRKWGLQREVTRVDHTPLPYDNTGTREWYVMEVTPKLVAEPDPRTDGPSGKPNLNQQIYFTFVVFPPAEYTVGSPADEARHQPDEQLQRVKLTRPLAVSTYETTWAQYCPLAGGQLRAALEREHARKLTDEEPVCRVSWLDAVDYCRVLTDRAGWPESEQCYEDPRTLPKDSQGGPQHSKVELDRHGYRLLTEAEWEYMCRCGMRTAYSFGSDSSLLTHYAWFLDNSENWSHPVGQLRPNLRGMFDVHGNLWEWCSVSEQHDGPGPDNTVDPARAKASFGQVRRGGSWDSPVSGCRAAFRSIGEPDNRRTFVGFRIATFPAGP